MNTEIRTSGFEFIGPEAKLVRNWCKEHIGEFGVDWITRVDWDSRSPKNLIWAFKLEKDALHFALRWL